MKTFVLKSIRHESERVFELKNLEENVYFSSVEKEGIRTGLENISQEDLSLIGSGLLKSGKLSIRRWKQLTLSKLNKT